LTMLNSPFIKENVLALSAETAPANLPC